MFDPMALRERLRRADPDYYTLEVCDRLAGQLDRIESLKRERNAVLLAHNYQRPEVFEIADFTGDSLGLSLEAAMVREAETIVFCGVHFMAETAKVVNPQRRVLLPNLRAGCSLADTAEETRLYERIEELRRDLGDLAVVCYINTTAAVKALCDACCTSANAVAVVRALPQQNVLFLPDRNLARHVANQLPEKNVIAWEGYCYVHQEIDPETIAGIRQTYPDLKVLAHPECRDDVVRLADAALSTSGMVEYARKSPDRQFLAVTECGLSDLLAIEVPDKQFLRACRICRFMKMITLDDIIRSLECLQPEIALPAYVREGAGRSLRRMFELTTPDRMPEALYGVSLN